MTELLERPEVVRRAQARPSRSEQGRPGDAAGSLRVAFLVLAAILPFGRVFATGEWVIPLAIAGLLPVASSWILRRARSPWWIALGVTVIAWLWYSALALLPNTLWAGVLPTLRTAQVAIDAAGLAIERVVVLPAPVYPEIPLLLLAITGVWWVASSIDVLALRLGSPGKAVICATTLWLVPLAIVPDGRSPSLLATPLLMASVVVILAQADREALRWGQVVSPAVDRQTTPARHPLGLALAIGAVLVGTILAGLLPGFGDPPWYQLRAQAATTLTANPIVQLRANLVANDTGPILRVRSDEPVYLRSTALDQYSETEEWTATDIQPRPLNNGYVAGGNFTAQRKRVRVDVVNLSDAVLVPAPTGAIQFSGPDGVQPLYDESTSTFTFADTTLQTGQQYAVVASTPEINPEVIATLDTPAAPELTQLPARLPGEVGALARRIVDDAGAIAPFAQAIAIQNELRTWDYSLQPPPGHSGVAMRTFLEQRVGYCEQFAGTMAVMLRTLGIPARVAVGFTPGTVDPQDPTLWTVTWGNAHAWVEVKFGGEWVAFEPTPRSDGNVLVPTPQDLTPATTLLEPPSTSRDPVARSSEQFNIFDEREALQNREPQTPPSAGSGFGGAAEQVSRRLTDPSLIAALVALSLASLVLLIALGRRVGRGAGPRSRILTVREQVDRLGHGLGTPAPAWETDREYLTRVGGGSPASRTLGAAVTQARYAADVPAGLADQAEAAGAELMDTLLEGRPAWQQTLVKMRGDVVAGWRRLTARLPWRAAR